MPGSVYGSPNGYVRLTYARLKKEDREKQLRDLLRHFQIYEVLHFHFTSKKTISVKMIVFLLVIAIIVSIAPRVYDSC